MPTSFRYLLTALVLLALPLEGQELVRKVGGYEVLVRASEGNGVIEISPVTPGSSRVFTLPSPRRLVIDLPGRDAVQNEAVEIAPHGFIRRLRVGTHPDRMRIVVDVGSESLRYAQRLEGKTSILALRSGDTEKSQPQVHLRQEEGLPALNPVPEEAQKEVRPNGEPGERSPSFPTPSPPSVDATPMPSKIGSTEGGDRGRTKDKDTRLSAIEFRPEALEVRLKLTARSPFGLVRRHSREYVITVPGGSMTSEAFGLDHFPPRELVGFTFVRAVQVGETLHIEVGVDHNSKIIAVPDRSDIVLRSAAVSP